MKTFNNIPALNSTPEAEESRDDTIRTQLPIDMPNAMPLLHKMYAQIICEEVIIESRIATAQSDIDTLHSLRS